MEEKWQILIVVGITFLIVLVVILVLFENWKKQRGIFGPYSPPPPPPNSFFPQGKITPLTEDQLAQNALYLQCLREYGVAQFDEKCSTIADNLVDTEDVIIE